MPSALQQRITKLESLCLRSLYVLDDDPGISDASFERLDQLVDDLREALGLETWAEAHLEDMDEQGAIEESLQRWSDLREETDE